MSCICRSSWAGVIIDQRSGYFMSVGGWLADLAAVLRLIGQSSINESSWWWHLSGNAVVVVMISGLLSFLRPQGLVCTHNPKDRTRWEAEVVSDQNPEAVDEDSPVVHGRGFAGRTLQIELKAQVKRLTDRTDHILSQTVRALQNMTC